MVMEQLSPAEARIASAIAQAESRTAGEIFCVLAGKVSSYRDVSLAWAAGAALSVPLLLVGAGLDPTALAAGFRGWEVGHVVEQDVAVRQAIWAFVIMQAATFVLTFLLTSIPAVRRFVTPRGLRSARVRKAAMQQFLAHGLHVTEARTGVLLFACLADHQVEIIADRGIHEKVDQSIWGDAVEALARGLKQGDPAAGFEAAIHISGEVLAEHFPPAPRDRNELQDRLVVI